MNIKTGCDIVHIPRFKEAAQKGGRKFFEKIFSAHELSYAQSEESLAGIFAAKEAVIKALEFKPGEWKKIEINKNKHRPQVKLAEFENKIISHDISISHDGEYVLAVAVFLL